MAKWLTAIAMARECVIMWNNIFLVRITVFRTNYSTGQALCSVYIVLSMCSIDTVYIKHHNPRVSLKKYYQTPSYHHLKLNDPIKTCNILTQPFKTELLIIIP